MPGSVQKARNCARSSGLGTIPSRSGPISPSSRAAPRRSRRMIGRNSTPDWRPRASCWWSRTRRSGHALVAPAENPPEYRLLRIWPMDVDKVKIVASGRPGLVATPTCQTAQNCALQNALPPRALLRIMIRVDTYRYGYEFTLERFVMTKQKRLYRLNDAARLVGVAPITLKRWLLQRKVREVRRDRNGWRVFDDGDIARIQAYASSSHKPGRQ